VIKPIKTPESNATLTGGDGTSTLPIIRTDNEPGEDLVISCWRGNLWDRLSFLLFGKLWLVVLSSTHPPLLIEVGRNYDVMRDNAAKD